MLKACWDCMAGDQQQHNDIYGVQLNGRTQHPPWNSVSDSNMFPAPTLNGNQIDKITIKGQMTADETLNLTIETSTGITWQINVDSGNNRIQIRNNEEVVYTTEAKKFFNSGTQYILIFQKSGTLTDINVSNSGDSGNFMEVVELDLNNLKNISVNGTVEMLTYNFN